MMNATKSAQKICVLGFSESGKTQIIRKHVLNEFKEKYDETLGAHVYKHTKNINYEGTIYTIANFLWDVPGRYQHKPSKVPLTYIYKADGVIGVYDCTNPSTLNELERILQENSDSIGKSAVVFAANKADLIAKSKRPRLPENHMYVSAKTGENIERLLKLLDKKILANGKL